MIELFFLSSDIISDLVPPGVFNFLIPGLVGGFVIAVLIYQFCKYVFNIDLLEGL